MFSVAEPYTLHSSLNGVDLKNSPIQHIQVLVGKVEAQYS